MFGNDCANTDKIDNNGKIDAKKRVRERISTVLKRSQKAGFSTSRMQELNFTTRSRSPE